MDRGPTEHDAALTGYWPAPNASAARPGSTRRAPGVAYTVYDDVFDALSHARSAWLCRAHVAGDLESDGARHRGEVVSVLEVADAAAVVCRFVEAGAHAILGEAESELDALRAAIDDAEREVDDARWRLERHVSSQNESELDAAIRQEAWLRAQLGACEAMQLGAAKEMGERVLGLDALLRADAWSRIAAAETPRELVFDACVRGARSDAGAALCMYLDLAMTTTPPQEALWEPADLSVPTLPSEPASAPPRERTLGLRLGVRDYVHVEAGMRAARGQGQSDDDWIPDARPSWPNDERDQEREAPQWRRAILGLSASDENVFALGFLARAKLAHRGLGPLLTVVHGVDLDSEQHRRVLAPYVADGELYCVASVTGDVTMPEIQWALSDLPRPERAPIARDILRSLDLSNRLFRRIESPQDASEIVSYCADCGSPLRAHFATSPCPACGGRARRAAAPSRPES